MSKRSPKKSSFIATKETEPAENIDQKNDDEKNMKIINNITNNFIYVNKNKDNKLASGQKYDMKQN